MSFITFRDFLVETANTILADINELITGYYLNNERWYDSEAEKQFNLRKTQAPQEQVDDAIGKAKEMAKEFIVWAKNAGYSGSVKKVWWTARPGSMSSAVGEPVDQRKNPTDILVQFTSGPANGFLGLSAKATKTKGDIGFKNPGIGTVDKTLGMNLSEYAKTVTNQIVTTLNLPKSSTQRKDFIRNNPQIKKQTEERGSRLLNELQDQFYNRLKRFGQKELLKYILTDWMDADILYPPYIKVTGQGARPPYKAVVSNPIDNPKLTALSTSEITLEKIGNDSVGVKAGKYKIMKMRFKFESEKLASSLKMSGDPW